MDKADLKQISDMLTVEQKTVIQSIGRYQDSNPRKAGIPPEDLEHTVGLEFAQLRPTLEKVLKDNYIEAVDLSESRPEFHIKHQLPQNVDEQSTKPAYESNYRFRLTQEGRRLCEQLPKDTPDKRQRFVNCAKKIIEKGWQIFTKSFWETVFDRVWPK